MKKRVVGFLLAVSLVMTACGSSAPVSTETDNVSEETTAEEEQESGTQEASESQEESGIEEAAVETGGGIPWIASDLKENVTDGMELSPKDDFYLYVNHDWIMDNDMPAGYSLYSTADEIEEESRAKVQALLEDEELGGHEAELVRHLYNACLDWDTRNELGMEPVMDYVNKIREAEDLEAVSALITDPDINFIMSVFMEYGIITGLEDATTYVTVISHNSFLLSDAAEYGTRTALGDRYYQAKKEEAVGLLERIGYEQEEAEELFDAVIDLETQLAEVSLTSADEMSPDYIDKINNIMTLSELTALSGNYPMQEWIRSVGIEKSRQFLVQEPEYIKRLDEIYTEENLEAIKGHLLICFLFNVADTLDKEAYDLVEKANSILYGSEGQVSDEEYAYSVLTDILPGPLGKAYVTKYDASKTKQDIEEICYELIDAYRNMLAEEDWLSEETKERAVSKLDHMVVNAVYPDEWDDYSGLSLDDLTYMESILAIVKFRLEKNLKKMDQKVDRTEWVSDNILLSNAFYAPSKNSINIFLGYLGGDSYSEDMTREEILGGIGITIAHEISHAFDPSGAQYDEEGNYNSWWTEEDYAVFQERTDKLIRYYNNITVHGDVKVIGENIQTEAIADLAGMKSLLAIAAGEEDFDYDDFFRQFARFRKMINTLELENVLLTQDSHPLHFLRVNVSVQQYDEFYDTYDIQPGDNMYLAEEDRILVW